MATFDRQYQSLINAIMNEGIEEQNRRTGHYTRALPGRTIEVDDVNSDFPLLTLRKIPLRLFIAEQIWFLMGERSPDSFLAQFTQIWSDFTNINGIVATAYGYRWRHHFHRDQINDLVELLVHDSSSRQGVVIAWDPSTDGLSSGINRKNLPCPYSFTVNIIGGKLNLHNIVRSNDVMLGLPHDVAGFCLLQHILAERLGVVAGRYTHSISHAHIYDIHYDAANTILERKPAHEPIKLALPQNAYGRALQGDTTLVYEIEASFASQYHPQPSVGRMQIVL